MSAGVRRWDVRQIGEKRLATGKVAGQSWRRRIYKFPTARTREQRAREVFMPLRSS